MVANIVRWDHRLRGTGTVFHLASLANRFRARRAHTLGVVAVAYIGEGEGPVRDHLRSDRGGVVVADGEWLRLYAPSRLRRDSGVPLWCVHPAEHRRARELAASVAEWRLPLTRRRDPRTMGRRGLAVGACAGHR